GRAKARRESRDCPDHAAIPTTPPRRAAARRADRKDRRAAPSLLHEGALVHLAGARHCLLRQAQRLVGGRLRPRGGGARLAPPARRRRTRRTAAAAQRRRRAATAAFRAPARAPGCLSLFRRAWSFSGLPPQS